MIETKPWDVAEVLTTPEDIAAYLEAYLEDGTSDELREVIRTVARAKGMTGIADATGLSRAGLHKTLGEGGSASFETISAILKVLGGRVPDAACAGSSARAGR